MPNKHYIRGRRFEYEVKKDLEKQGFLVMRASGSHGVFDLIALNSTGDVLLIQCKTTNNEKEINRLRKQFDKVIPFDQEHYTQMLLIKVTGKKPTLYVPGDQP